MAGPDLILLLSNTTVAGAPGINGTQLIAILEQYTADVDALWMLLAAFMVFGMQIGFALVEAGSILTNLRSILMKNIFDVCLSALSWWVLGYSIAKGRYGNSFWAIDLPFHLPPNKVAWFFDLSFAATSATIVSGAMAERTKFSSYVAFTLVITSVIYPAVAHWVWSPDGFMAGGEHAAFLLLDFAGCGVVHMVGGIAGLVGAWIVGPRPGAFVDGDPGHYTANEAIFRERMRSTQLLWQVVGTIVLWVGWYGFNCGSAGGIIGQVDKVARIAINTTTGAVLGATAAVVVSYVHKRVFVLDFVLMGILSGLVAVTAGAPYMETPFAALTGLIGFFWFYGGNWALHALRIDDPVSAFPVHGLNGFWGLIATGLFQQPRYSCSPYPYATQVGWQVVGALIITVWSFVTASAVWFVLQLLTAGSMRIVNAEQEYVDVDVQSPQIGPHGCVTLVFTDIQGSTVLWETDERCMTTALHLHDNAMRALIREHKGFEVKTEGDAFMIAFRMPADACRFCIALQRQLMTVKWPTELYACPLAGIEADEEGQIVWKGVRVRMGFHVGTPMVKESPMTGRTDYFGRDVNYAARVSSARTGGQIITSSVTMEQLLECCVTHDGECAIYDLDMRPDPSSPPPFGMEIGRQYDLPGLECSVEYLGKVVLKGIRNDPHGECLYQVSPQ